jgi:hypothetical protein
MLAILATFPPVLCLHGESAQAVVAIRAHCRVHGVDLLLVAISSIPFLPSLLLPCRPELRILCCGCCYYLINILHAAATAAAAAAGSSTSYTAAAAAAAAAAV